VNRVTFNVFVGSSCICTCIWYSINPLSVKPVADSAEGGNPPPSAVLPQKFKLTFFYYEIIIKFSTTKNQTTFISCQRFVTESNFKIQF
jgi:hypothetical protein